MLERQLDAPPAGYRFVLIGEHLVLMDPGWHARDIICLNLNDWKRGPKEHFDNMRLGCGIA